jgi:hypothetical protein
LNRKPGVPETLLVAAIIAIIAYQSRYLFVYPQIDTGMWFGDESWTMFTLRELARTGIARIPEAIGSSISVNNGLINGVIWVPGLLYGVPAHLFRSLTAVEVGRVITLVLSIALLHQIYRVLVDVAIARTIALAVILALVASPVFYFSSHSARLDVLTALAVVCFLRAFVSLSRSTRPRYFLIGLFVGLSLAIYVHVPSLIVLPWLYSVAIANGGMARWYRSIAGAGVGALVLIAVYYAGVHDIALLGSGQNQYHAVTRSLPVLHPFSWQVQKINTIDRFIQVWQVMWPVIVLLIAGAFALVLRRDIDPSRRLIVVLCGLVLLSWMLFEGPAVFYEIHAAPVFAILAAIGLGSISTYRQGSAFRTDSKVGARTRSAIAVAAVVFAALSMYAQRRAGAAGQVLFNNNRSGIADLLSHIDRAGLPIILADQPAWNILGSTAGVRLMTSHLLLFGGEQRSVPDILRVHSVQYLALYSTSHFQSPFRNIADSLYDVVDTRIGMLTDEARGYDPTDWTSPDTLRLYRSRWTR